MHTTTHPRSLSVLLGALLVAVFAARSLTAQNAIRPNGQNPNGQNQNAQRGNNAPSVPKAPPLPNDDRLMALHRRFVQDAEKLAAEYEQKKQLDKAAAVYEEMLKLVPAYTKAQQSLGKIRDQEATANQTAVIVEAKEWWQDTGVRLIAGKPIKLLAQGKWTLKLAHELSPEGMNLDELPKNCKLGSLIGVIVAPGDDPKKMKPFPIGMDTSLVADRSGALWVAMCDVDHQDNSGHVTLTCVGRFDLTK